METKLVFADAGTASAHNSKKEINATRRVHLTVMPITAKRQTGEFDLFGALEESVRAARVELQDGDVVVMSSKYVSNSQGRLVSTGRVRPSADGMRLSRRHRLSPELAEVVLRESDFVFGGIPGFVITSGDHIMAPNAGIDRSNASGGELVLYPYDPYRTCEEIRRKVFLEMGVHVGVILADSRLMPARVGTAGVAIACAGIEPVNDMRAVGDLDGTPLKVTFQATADNLASIANHKMGEGAESRPVAIVRNSGARLTGRRISPDEMAVPYDQCVYVRGLGGRGTG